MSYYTYSAIAVVVLVGITFLLNLPGRSSSRKIFDTYFEPYPDITIHQRSETGYNKFDEAMHLYNSGKYEASIDIFNSLDNKKEDQITFYKGVSLLATDQPFKAASELQPLTEKESGEFYYESNWYSALAFLKLERPEEAAYHLKIAKGSSDYNSSATNILTELANE